MLRGLVASLTLLAAVAVPLPGGSRIQDGTARRMASRLATPVDPTPASAHGDERTDAAEAPRVTGAPLRYPTFLRPLAGEQIVEPPAPRAVRELLLSFDDGPDLFGTPLVLEELDRRGLKGIFFVNGRYLLGSRPQDLARRDLVRKLAAHGHLVANHTLNHKNLCQFPAAVPEEVDTNSEVIAYATGLRPLLFRSPYGARCRSLDEALRQRDLVQVGWNLDPQEWQGGDQDAVFAYVTRHLIRLQGRAILLLHDSNAAAVRALPRILNWIDDENRRAVRAGRLPIRVVDYSVFLPEATPVPPVGLEPVVARFADSFRRLPGVGVAAARLRVVE